MTHISSPPPAEPLALSGKTVVSIAINLPGPVCAAALATMGAHVINVLPPDGDPLQQYSPSYYDELHAHTEQVTVDLKSLEGRRNLDELLADADVLITSSRARALVKLGLTPSDTAQRFERLSRVDIVGSRAAPDVAGHDLTYQAAAGLLNPTSTELPRALLADLMGAQRAVSAALECVLIAQASGHGAQRTIALEESAALLAVPLQHALTSPGGILGGGTPGYALYPCADGMVALAALEPHFMKNLAKAFGEPLESLTAKRLTALFAAKPCCHWQAWAAAWDVPLVAFS